MQVKKCDKCGSDGAVFKASIKEQSGDILSVFRNADLLDAELCRKCAEQVRAFIFNVGSIQKT